MTHSDAIEREKKHFDTAMLIMARAHCGEFGKDGFGRTPGIWMLSSGLIRMGNHEVWIILKKGQAREVAAGLLKPEIPGYLKTPRCQVISVFPQLERLHA